jgi:predicted anti-sigma-YlaC factor YlaD
MTPGSNARRWAAVVLVASLPACSIRKLAVNSLGNALASGGDTYATDDDPELVGAAIPFGLKTVESLLAEAPRHRGLLYAAASGFTQYAYGFVQQEADFVEGTDLPRATAQRTRARKLYVRALGYGLRGLELDFPGLRERLLQDRVAALRPMQKKHVPLLYWTGLSWFAAISLDKTDSSLSADQSVAEALLHRALELDPDYDSGGIHEFYIAWEGRGEAVGGSFTRAREGFQEALRVSRGSRAAPFVSLAESVSVATQNRKEFEDLLNHALAVDVEKAPKQRLSNVLYQRRARWLLARVDELFIE